MKLKQELDNIRRIYPRHSRYGQMLPSGSKRKAWKKVTLYTIFVSDENTHLIRPHVFEKSRPLTPADWHAWFSANLTQIHSTGILPGLNIRTGKFWSVQRIIGWAADDAQHKTRNPAVGRARHKTAKGRRKNG